MLFHPTFKCWIWVHLVKLLKNYPYCGLLTLSRPIFCWRYIYPPPSRSLTAKAPESHGGWKILSYWGLVTFQGRAVKLREGNRLSTDILFDDTIWGIFKTLKLVHMLAVILSIKNILTKYVNQKCCCVHVLYLATNTFIKTPYLQIQMKTVFGTRGSFFLKNTATDLYPVV